MNFHPSKRGTSRNERVANEPEILVDTLFLGDLSSFTDERVLSNAFVRFGELVEVRVKRSGDGSMKPLCYGFIQFRSIQSAVAALQAMNGKLLQGRALRIRWATSKRVPDILSGQMRESSRVKSRAQVLVSFLSNTIALVTEQHLRDAFAPLGEIVDCTIKKSTADMLGRHSGYGFVDFEDNERGISAAVAAIDAVKNLCIGDVVYECRMSVSLRKHLLELESESQDFPQHKQQLQEYQQQQPPHQGQLWYKPNQYRNNIPNSQQKQQQQLREHEAGGQDFLYQGNHGINPSVQGNNHQITNMQAAKGPIPNEHFNHLATRTHDAPGKLQYELPYPDHQQQPWRQQQQQEHHRFAHQQLQQQQQPIYARPLPHLQQAVASTRALSTSHSHRSNNFTGDNCQSPPRQFQYQELPLPLPKAVSTAAQRSQQIAFLPPPTAYPDTVSDESGWISQHEAHSYYPVVNVPTATAVNRNASSSGLDDELSNDFSQWCRIAPNQQESRPIGLSTYHDSNGLLIEDRRFGQQQQLLRHSQQQQQQPRQQQQEEEKEVQSKFSPSRPPPGLIRSGEIYHHSSFHRFDSGFASVHVGSDHQLDTSQSSSRLERYKHSRSSSTDSFGSSSSSAPHFAASPTTPAAAHLQQQQRYEQQQYKQQYDHSAVEGSIRW